jgi:hypothetical protein
MTHLLNTIASVCIQVSLHIKDKSALVAPIYQHLSDDDYIASSYKEEKESSNLESQTLSEVETAKSACA